MRGEAKIALEKSMHSQKIGDKVKLLDVGRCFEVPKINLKEGERDDIII